VGSRHASGERLPAEGRDGGAARARLAELERAEETARALIGVGRELVGTLDLAQSIDRLVTTVLDLFRVRRAVLYRIEPASGNLLCVAAAGEGDPAKWIGRTLEPGVGIAGLSVSQGGPVCSPDPLADPRVTLPEWARRRFQDEGYRSVAAVPLIARGKVLGTLALGAETGRVFTDEELAVLATFADHVALAIQNADLFEETQQRLTQMETLLSVSCAIGSWGGRRPSLAAYVTLTGPRGHQGRGDRRRMSFVLPSMKRLAVSSRRVPPWVVVVAVHRTHGVSGLARFRHPSIRAHRGQAIELAGAGGDSRVGAPSMRRPRTAAKATLALTHPSNLREPGAVTVVVQSLRLGDE
jgi:hypothetical protein